jgi:DNA polymerase-1
MQGIGFDTMLESYLLNPSTSRHDLDGLALQYLGTNTIHFEDIAGVGKKQLTFNQIPIEKAAPYAAEDVDIVLQLHHKLWTKIIEQEKLTQVFTSIDMPLVPVLARLELNGVCIDTNLLIQQSTVLSHRINQLEQQAYQLAGQIFNLASPKQLQEILFTKLKLPISKKTPGGQPSTAENVLQDLALNYPLPKIILEHRSLSKLRSTYTNALPQQINSRTHRVHTSYNQAVTATGRLSSTNPNLQNIPIRTEEGRNIRKAFIAPKGKKIISADYSQIELRIMAHLSQDEGLLKAFSDGHDIHKATASEVFNIPLDQVTAEQRRKAKAINFGLIYGMSAYGLTKQLGISSEQAQQYIELYFARYPQVKMYMENARKQARQKGYVETLFGRRLYVPDINSTNFARRSAAERAAINAPMQGTAADIIKIAMINIDKWIQTTKPNIKMIMQVHDELVFETTDAADYTDVIQRHMSQAITLSVPIVVHIGVGNNWDEAH